MERIIQFLTKDDSSAYTVVDTLQDLNMKGDIDVAEIFVLKKDANGNVFVKDSRGAEASNAIYDSLIGGLIGLITGPIGFLFGISIGALIGSADDLDEAGFQRLYIDEISKDVPNGQNVVIAHVNEEWEAAINANLSSIAEIRRYNMEEELEKLYARQRQELKDKINAKRFELDHADEHEKGKVQNELTTLEKQLKRLRNLARMSVTSQKNAYKKWLTRTRQI